MPSVLVVAVECAGSDQSVILGLVLAPAPFGVRRVQVLSLELYDLGAHIGHLEDLVPLLNYPRSDELLERGLKLLHIGGCEGRSCRAFAKLVLVQRLGPKRHNHALLIAHPLPVRNLSRHIL